MSLTTDDVNKAAQKTTPIIRAALDDLTSPLSTARRKLRVGRDTYAPVIIDHLNPALAIAFNLTVAEVDALLAAASP